LTKIQSKPGSSADLDFNLKDLKNNVKLPSVEDTKNEMKNISLKQKLKEQAAGKHNFVNNQPTMQKKLPKIAINFLK